MNDTNVGMNDTNARGARPDVAVVGGGLAGLAAATTAARTGARVTLFEAREERGGRARTERIEGFSFNQGAHALYRAGAGFSILRELGVQPKGRLPRQRGGRWVHDGRATPLSQLRAIGGAQGVRVALRMASRRVARAAGDMSMAAWFDGHVDDGVRPFAEMLARTSGYAVDFAHQHAGETLQQVRRGTHGVLYLHGGWSSLVDPLAASATRAGVTISHERVARVEASDATVGLSLGSGAEIEAGAVVLAAGGATHADKLLGGTSPMVARWAADARPVRATCLDVALRRLPSGRPLTAYGLGEPTYFIDHARTAWVAPDGGALVHCLWYEPDLVPDIDHRAELEARLDLLEPDWRAEVVDVRFSRRLVVAHDRPQPGVVPAGRPAVTVDDLPRVFVAGDWLTADGLLADAALSSGRDAGRAAAAATTARGVAGRAAGRPTAAAR